VENAATSKSPTVERLNRRALKALGRMVLAALARLIRKANTPSSFKSMYGVLVRVPP
jgi:hypothetical protein